MEKLNLEKNNLKKFGMITMPLGFLFLASLIFIIRRKNIFIPAIEISALFFAIGLFLPVVLKPVYIFWMRLAFVLGWINTRLILCIMFYLIFTPIGLVMRLFCVDLLNKKIERNKSSYWLKKEKKEFDPSVYEHQF